jgi:hypothetical protein
MSVMEATVDPLSPGSRLDADHPENGVLIPCRFTVGADLVARFAVLAVAMQRDRAARRPEWSHAFLAVLDPQLLVEQTPPDHDCLAGKLGSDLVRHARDGQTAVDADQAPLRLARESAESIPGAHLPDAGGGQVRQPVVNARMRLGPVIAPVIGGDKACEPAVRLRFGLGLMEMVERLVRVLHGTERPFHLALGARRRPPPIRAGGHVRQDLDAEAFHYALEHRRFGDRPVVEGERRRDALGPPHRPSPAAWATWR